MSARSSLASLRRRRRGDAGFSLAKHTVGNALVVCPEDRMSAEAQQLAMSVAPDTEHEMVVVDLPAGMPVAAWDSVAQLLPRHRRGVRLIIGGRSREATALTGQWLSERIGRTVVAPDGAIFRGTGGTLFVHSGKGSGWVKFRPGRAPEWDAKRFPRPSWDSGAVDAWATSSAGMADPIPGGVWIHPAASDADLSGHWSQLVRGMPCQPDSLTIVLGCPGLPALSLDDVSRFWQRLDEGVRDKVRFVQYGPVRVSDGDTLGQALADLLGARVVCYPGMPVGSPAVPAVYTVCEDGGLGWQPFARELAYTPKSDAEFRSMPKLLSHRVPVEGVEQVTPGVYWYTPDAVLEVVQSGLWMRPRQDPQNADAVRAEPWQNEVALLAFDATDSAMSERMRLLAQDVLARLDPATRVRCRLVPASDLGRGVVRVIGPARGELEPTSDQPVWSSTETVRLAAVLADSSAESPLAERSVTVSTAVESQVPEVALDEGPAERTVAMTTVAPSPPPADKAAADKAAAVPEPPAVTGPASAMAIRLESSVGASFDEPAPPAPVGEATTAEPVAPQPPAAPPKNEAPAAQRKQPVRRQPTPERAASALASHDLTQERAWLRKTLSRDFDTMAHSVSRILSEHPGFQGDARSSADVLADTVAVQLYLSARGESIDQALRTAANGPHVPFARCVVSGLTRLPSHRGATIFTASPAEAQWQLYRQRNLVTDWSFIHALTEPGPDQQGDTDVLVWSMTARRTRLLEPGGADQVDNRVVFVPGTSFKILELAGPQADGTRGRILLRELAASEIDENGRVDTRASLDELGLTSLRQCVERWASAPLKGAVGESAASRFGAMPGLVGEGDG
ncbi:hypothetical protein ALI144C_16530 [Actinosynnema sp. ALI-1.44]|uniref:hypothetical protein n=1 Tax=Actinosynnema sp. ALI-1.44 TaxID=1933779 RepID=UPI00097C6CD2|nr:hypothetical protein [Actinosynnema sp. ALI-1.44]ONI83112.1 hypothetical protein ALI144C_16530 [Actinosynnema sp. ALI-1.44]